MTETTNNVVNKKSGKLSSRNTRRKRRDNRDNNSTKKSKAPIPSFAFTPIIEDDEEVEESEELTLRSEQRVVANDAKSLSIAATANIPDEEIKQQKKLSHESVDDDDKKAAATSAAANSNGNLLETNDAGSNNSMDVNSIQCNKTSACQNVVVKEVTELIISQTASKQTDQNLTDPARTQKDNHQTDSNTKTTRKTVYDMLEVAECKIRSDSCSKTSAAGETIEILDDDDEEDKKDLPLVSRNNSSVSRDSEANVVDKPRLKTDPISVESSDEDGIINQKTTSTIATKKRTKPTRRKATTGKSKVEIKSTTNDDTTSVTQKKPRKKAKLCTACASCQCQSKDGSAATSSLQKLSQLSGSDARVEQTLKNRMLKIERNLALTEGQRHDCARELKRHRGVIQKKMSKTGANTKKRQHFLADAQISDEMAQAFATARVDQKKVKQTKNHIFGKSSKKEPQPTLTQMFGGGDCSEREGDRSDDDHSCNGDTSSADERSQADEPHDPLSFWNNNESIHKDPFLGSMAQFEEASIRFKNKQLRSTAVWAKATASVIKNETTSQSRKKEEDEVEEGIDALLELFDISPEKRPDPTISSQDDDECIDDSIIKSQLSQAGVKAVEGITEEIVSDDSKRSAIERTCPQWKENIEYSFRHTDSDSLEKALNQVKKEKQRLKAVKERILQAFLDRSSTLEVYEKAIEGSLLRLAEKENENT